MIKAQTLKGFRDFLPVEARKRQYVISTLKSVFERYGFEPLETPAMEYEEVLTGKYGDEGDQLMYRFEDNGQRRVALRYDQTVPTARVAAQYASILPQPFKRYQIQPVWRAENTQKGRYREFVQCDIDTIGIDSPLADAEILATIFDSYKALGLNILIKFNDRALLKEISSKALPVLDKLNKIGELGVLEELEGKGFKQQEAKDLLNQAKAFKESLRILEIKQLYKQMGYPEDSLQFEGTLIRGLNYYTGIILEIVLKENPNGLSLGGGGRYDELIGMFANKQIPATGFAFGFDRMIEAMDELNLFPQDIVRSSTKVLVTVFSEELKQKSLEITSQLREKNINAEIYLGEVKDKNPLEKQMKYADAKKIPYVLILGPQESNKKVITLRNMLTREQEQSTIETLLKTLAK